MRVMLAVALLLVCTARLARADQSEDCANADKHDLTIAACSAIIAEASAGDKLAWAHNNRGVAYSGRGELELALADFDRAISLDGSNYRTFLNRGKIHMAAGSPNLGIADHVRATQLAPDHVMTWSGLGLARFTVGDFVSAIPDLREALRRTTASDAMIYLYLAQKRLGREADAELEAHVSSLNGRDWPYPVYELFVGRRSASSLLGLAQNPEEQCEARLFVGEWHLLKGDVTNAGEHFRTAIEVCRSEAALLALARTELRRLAQ